WGYLGLAASGRALRSAPATSVSAAASLSAAASVSADCSAASESSAAPEHSASLRSSGIVVLRTGCGVPTGCGVRLGARGRTRFVIGVIGGVGLLGDLFIARRFDETGGPELIGPDLAGVEAREDLVLHRIGRVGAQDAHLGAGDLLRLGMTLTVAVDGGLQLGIAASGAALLGQSRAEEVLDLPVPTDDGIGLDPIDHLVEALGGVLVHR